MSEIPKDAPTMPRVDCPRCGTSKEIFKPCSGCPRTTTLSAAESIFWIRHHCQMALGEMAKLAQSNLITTPARSAIELRLYAAMNLADSYEEAPRVPDPPDDDLASKLRRTNPEPTEPS